MAFALQRGRARERGVEWNLEYWEWLQIWQDSGHLHERGVRGGEWVMGRIGDVGPYASDNVKIIRVETNASDAARYRRARKTDAAAPLSD
jgi:hypothetical protein